MADYTHDANGNFNKLPQLKNGRQANAQNLHWDYRNQLIKADLDLNNNVAHYHYDSAGQRTRKVVIKGGLREELIYFGNYEIYRKYNSTTSPKFERQTLHIMDDKQRIALFEHRTIGGEDGVPATRFRYQLSNHLGTSVTEIDETDQAKIISYEEYYPYGGTAYIGGREGEADDKIASSKRYRYSGKERDDETGLYYYGARYYAAWLGKWISCDPAGIVDGTNLFVYSKSNPVVFFDNAGLNSNGANQKEIGGPEIIIEQEFTGKETRQELENIANSYGYTIKGGHYWEEGYGWRAELEPLRPATSTGDVGNDSVDIEEGGEWTLETAMEDYKKKRDESAKMVFAFWGAWAGVVALGVGAGLAGIGIAGSQALAGLLVTGGSLLRTAVLSARLAMYSPAVANAGAFVAGMLDPNPAADYGPMLVGEDAARMLKAAIGFRGLNSLKRGHIAVLEMVTNQYNEFKFAIAGNRGTFEFLSDVIKMPNVRRFVTAEFARFDSELKALEHAAERITPTTEGTIRLFSEKFNCPGCAYVIQQFRDYIKKIGAKVELELFTQGK